MEKKIKTILADSVEFLFLNKNILQSNQTFGYKNFTKFHSISVFMFLINILFQGTLVPKLTICAHFYTEC